MITFRALLGSVLATTFVPTLASALTLAPGTYELHNHPDAAQAPPGYGLRLDELDGDANTEDTWTFDFDHAQSSVTMTIHGNGDVTIGGTVYGGEDVGTVYDHGQLFDFSLSYTGLHVDGTVLAAVGGIGSITAHTLAIGSYAAGTPISLQGEASTRPSSFYLREGHRGFAGVSGYGWVSNGATGHLFSPSDGMNFTVGDPVSGGGGNGGASPVPEPSAALLFGLGSAVVGMRTRR